MKKLSILIIIAALAGSVSCKNVKERFGGSDQSNQTLEEMFSKNQALQRKIREDSLMHIQELNMLRSQYEKEIENMKQTPALQKGVKGYLVVVGSFKNVSYAENYASKIKAMGFEGAVVEGPNNFAVVTSATYKTLKEAIEGQRIARGKLASEAWVYVKR